MTNEEIAKALGITEDSVGDIDFGGGRVRPDLRHSIHREFVKMLALSDWVNTPDGQEKIRDRVEAICAERGYFILEEKHPAGGRLMNIYETPKCENCLWFQANGLREEIILAALEFLWKEKEK